MSKISDSQIETARRQLQDNHVIDFVKSLENDEDPFSERHSLILALSNALQRLYKIEQNYILELTSQKPDEICPACLINNTIDMTRCESVVDAFNHYLDNEHDEH